MQPNTNMCTQQLRPESLKVAPGSIGGTFSNIATIEALNASHSFVSEDTPLLWVDNHLFQDAYLPKVFDIQSVCKSDIWTQRNTSEMGGDTFREIPTLTEEDSMKWLNNLGVSLGITHGLLDAKGTSEDHYGRTPSDDTPFCAFNHGGRNKPLSGGYSQRKPDLVLLDRDHPYHTAPSTDRLDWGPVHTLVEVSAQESHYKTMMTTLLHKAANIFHCQLHRQYVCGLAIFGKADNMKYFFVLVDRAGALSTQPASFFGFEGLAFA